MRQSLIAVAAAVGAVLLLAGCGGGSSSTSFPTVGAARTYEIVNFEPSAPVPAAKPTKVSFVIRQPNGKPLIIAAGTGNGIVLKSSGLAATTLDCEIEFVETAY